MAPLEGRARHEVSSLTDISVALCWLYLTPKIPGYECFIKDAALFVHVIPVMILLLQVFCRNWLFYNIKMLWRAAGRAGRGAEKIAINGSYGWQIREITDCTGLSSCHQFDGFRATHPRLRCQGIARMLRIRVRFSPTGSDVVLSRALLLPSRD